MEIPEQDSMYRVVLTVLGLVGLCHTWLRYVQDGDKSIWERLGIFDLSISVILSWWIHEQKGMYSVLRVFGIG